MPHDARPGLLSGSPVTDLAAHLARGGGRALAHARDLGGDGVVDAVTRAGLRGRGGAGFPTGRKWRTVADAPGGDRFVVANGAEGEPGTWKDRALVRHDAFAVVEGAAVAALAVGAEEVFLATKASYRAEVAALTTAVVEMSDAGLLGSLTVTIVQGPDAYLFGEETALLEVIEGGDPLPRIVPPYQQGLFARTPSAGWGTATAARRGGEANPTLVNNVETLAHVVAILADGPDAFRAVGTDETPGSLLATVSGDVVAPGVFEVAAGTPLREVLALAGGTRPGRAVQAVMPGVAVAVLGAGDLDVPLTHEALAARGSALGSAGFVVLDDTACMVDVAGVAARFLARESCGQCPPCKLGATAIAEQLGHLVARHADDRSLEVVHRWTTSVTDGARCALAGETRDVTTSILRGHPEEFALHLEGRCSHPRRLSEDDLVTRPPW